LMVFSAAMNGRFSLSQNRLLFAEHFPTVPPATLVGIIHQRTNLRRHFAVLFKETRDFWAIVHNVTRFADNKPPNSWHSRSLECWLPDLSALATSW
jgi:hypothetical protein